MINLTAPKNKIKKIDSIYTIDERVRGDTIINYYFIIFY